jgi:thymidylate kinase
MPHVETLYQPSLTDVRSQFIAPVEPSRNVFLSTLFPALEGNDVRYCVLHCSRGLVYAFAIAVHPEDLSKLASAFGALAKQGYHPMQSVDIANGRSRLVFGAVVDEGLETIALDVVFKNQTALHGTSPEWLINRRERSYSFWKPQLEDAFLLLLAEAVSSDEPDDRVLARLETVAGAVGKEATEARLREIFGSPWGEKAATGFHNSRFLDFIRDFGPMLRSRIVPHRARSKNFLQQRIDEKTSMNGAFLVFLGPDGVGKTTLLQEVRQSLCAAFAQQSLYRWRPGVFAKTPRTACLPHSKPLRSTRGSISYLLFTWIDFVAGHLLRTRSQMSRYGLVIFDRYYHDIGVDPKRYRYNGPMGLVRWLGRTIPPGEIFFFVLDADETAILSRKRQLPIDEIRRQRTAYREFARSTPNSVVINTDGSIPNCRAQALRAILPYLAAQTAKRNPGWFGTFLKVQKGTQPDNIHDITPREAPATSGEPTAEVRAKASA